MAVCGILPWVRTQCHVREYVGESEGVGEGKGWRVCVILPWVRTQCHVREYVGESEGVGEGKGSRVHVWDSAMGKDAVSC